MAGWQSPGRRPAMVVAAVLLALCTAGACTVGEPGQGAPGASPVSPGEVPAGDLPGGDQAGTAGPEHLEPPGDRASEGASPPADPTPGPDQIPDQADGTAGWTVPISAAEPPRDAPAVLGTEGASVLRWSAGEAEEIGRIEPRAGFAAGDGADTVVVERWPVTNGRGGAGEPPGTTAATSLQLLRGGQAESLVDGPALLYDVVSVGGRPHVLYGRHTGGSGGEPGGDIVLRDVASDAAAVVGPAFAPEFGVYAASAAGGTMVASAWSDLTETFLIRRLDGTPVEDFANPTADLAYNVPPWLGFAVVSPDRTRLAYLSGPDYDGTAPASGGEPQLVGSWQLVVADRSGAELLRLPLAGQELQLTSLDYDGRWALVSSAPAGAAGTTSTQPRAPLLIDTAGGPASYLLDGLGGRATLDLPPR